MKERHHHNHAMVTNQLERDDMKTPEDVAVILRLHELGWGKKRIAREMGISKGTVARYLRQGGYKPYRQPARRGALTDLKDWLRERFLRHRGNAEVVRQELVAEHKIEVSLRTVERAVEPFRKELETAARATLRFETPPGKQMQIDFGSTTIEINSEKVRVHLFVATLGYSRRIYVAPFRNEGQSSWLTGMDQAFRHFDGIPEEVLMDNARALVTQHDIKTREVTFNERLVSFAAYWRFKPRACAPYRARTKGKDERSVGYVKGNAIAGRQFKSWSDLENHLNKWMEETADQRIHATTEEKPADRFLAAEATALRPLKGKPPFYQSQDYIRRVPSDAHVEFDTNRYSVPWRYVGHKVKVHASQEEVRIYLEGHEISKHKRHAGRRQVVTRREDLVGIIGSSSVDKPSAEVTISPPKGELQRELSEYEVACGG